MDFRERKLRHSPRTQRYRSHRFGQIDQEDGFFCKHCKAFVSSASFLSGVRNRNHCPYCLYSCHMDLYEAGDRLSACKSPMKPIGLTTKTSRKKYGTGLGELMLIHLCIDCDSLSINRIAADDDYETIAAIFKHSLLMDDAMQRRLKAEGINILDTAGSSIIQAQLFGTTLEFS
jgi:RNHCP domain